MTPPGSLYKGARGFWTLAGLALLLAGVGWWLQDDRGTHFLPAVDPAFVAAFPPPTSADSAQTRRELQQLLELQRTRTAEQVARARADRKTRISQFYDALGLQGSPDLPRLQRLAGRVEDDVRIQVRALKKNFRRLRPYVIEPRLEPCIDHVQGDLSYPSGHAAYAASMNILLSFMVPERAEQLDGRATQFANQRALCGVHFPSDLAAGHEAAGQLLREMFQLPAFREEFLFARAELRAALDLPERPPELPPLN